jgi:hypothetical protein
MKVNQAYSEYMVPKTLQEHMLRVASLAEILLKHWTGIAIDKKAIVLACTLHDIAKPMNFDLAKQAKFGMSQEDIGKLGKLQNRLKSDYGNDEHHATVKICEKIGLSSTSVKLVDNLEWKFIPRLLQNNDLASLIPIYCDMRIGPKGILTLEKRLLELKERVGGDEYWENVKNGKLLEKQIKESISIEVNSITDNQINKRFEELRNQEI